jgi:hypothetical protein
LPTFCLTSFFPISLSAICASSAMRFALFCLAVDASVRGGEDFGKVGNGEFGNEGKGDVSPIACRPARNRTNELVNHVLSAFI